MTGPPASNTTTYTYDTANNLATVSYPNGVESQFTYDSSNRVSDVSSQVSGYTYLRGASGNLTNSLESDGRSVTWTYDGIYRLTNEQIEDAPNGKNGSIAYSLDPVGNRLSDLSTIAGINAGSWSYNASCAK